MQLPPLSFSDISLLLAIGAIILLITSGLSSSYLGQTNLTINKKKLESVALAMGILGLATVVIRIVGLMMTA